jgi:hypothetical protein
VGGFMLVVVLGVVVWEVRPALPVSQTHRNI